jgi:outer membrane protein OmpA-like peptidoglycan-associated protein
VFLANLSKRYFYCFVLQLCGIYNVDAQNLLPNPSFEAINICVEYKADCSPEAWFNIPATNTLVKANIAPKPYFGNMVLIVPVGNVMENFNKPRYIYTGLCCPLLVGKKYVLSFYINTAGLNFNQLAIYLAEKEPSLAGVNALPAAPSIIITQQNILAQKKENWYYVQCEYTATGNENFFIITTKGTNSIAYFMPQAMNKSGDVLYFIDEIELKAKDSLPLCAAYNKNIDKLFDYNYRHTNNFLVFEEAVPQKPVVKFINDTVVIPGLLFDVNKSNIKSPVAKILDSLVIILKQKSVVQINITGHTDSTGNENNNQLLSQARAAAVKDYIGSKLPEINLKIAASGKASAQPVATNNTATARQRNRRVQVIITYALSLQ